MDIRVGIINSPREVVIELADGHSADDAKAAVEAGIAAGGLVWFTDKRGRQVGFPATQVAYVEIGDADEQRIGFG